MEWVIIPRRIVNSSPKSHAPPVSKQQAVGAESSENPGVHLQPGAGGSGTSVQTIDVSDGEALTGNQQ